MEENEGTLDENDESVLAERIVDSIMNELLPERDKKGPCDLEKEQFEKFRKRHMIESLYDNALNGLIEQTGVRSVLENEAVSMAIRFHGLTYPVVIPGTCSNPDPCSSGPCSSSMGDDILSHAVSAAIKKKGLGAIGR